MNGHRNASQHLSWHFISDEKAGPIFPLDGGSGNSIATARRECFFGAVASRHLRGDDRGFLYPAHDGEFGLDCEVSDQYPHGLASIVRTEEMLT